ncbi:hypothetical protein [Peribacillus frigoritolerans]|uniref:hypothetical protein n=1 Tax=Peribacillus frigoritolerans TaxID=450367 RepID=UPI003FA363D5
MESPNVATYTKQEEPQIQSTANVLKFIIYSLIGSFMFFSHYHKWCFKHTN